MTVAATLALEIAGFRALLHTLDAEAEALRLADSDVIDKVAQAKVEQVHALENLARVRRDGIAARGLPMTAAGVHCWLAEVDRDAGHADAWGTLVALASTAREANARNGRLLSHQQRQVDSALGALLAARGTPALYGGDGRTHGANPTRVRTAA